MRRPAVRRVVVSWTFFVHWASGKRWFHNLSRTPSPLAQLQTPIKGLREMAEMCIEIFVVDEHEMNRFCRFCKSLWIVKRSKKIYSKKRKVITSCQILKEKHIFRDLVFEEEIIACIITKSMGNSYLGASL